MESTPRNRSRRWWIAGIIGTFVLGVLLFCSLLIVLVVRMGRTTTAEGPITWSERYVSGKGEDRIAVLPIEGVIGGGGGGLLASVGASPEDLKSQLQQAADDNSVKAIILEVDSPGGGVVESDEMHEAVEQFKQKTHKPVVVSMGSVTASGGYYVSTAADKIVANRSTITGSLGVIFEYLNYANAEKKLGLEEVVIKSGQYKDIGAPWRAMTAAERQILQGIINESYDQFVAVIVQGRHLPEQKVRALADGRIYSGQQAAKLGLVDQLGDLDVAVGTAQGLAHVNQATVVRYTRNESLLGLLTSKASADSVPNAAALLQAAGVNLKPELEYLYRP